MYKGRKEADLRPNEIQDLGDAMGDLLQAADGHELQFHLRVTLAGKPPEAVVHSTSAVLRAVKEGFEFKKG
jgi:hypothetical protein